jgi:hypothetical protein
MSFTRMDFSLKVKPEICDVMRSLFRTEYINDSRFIEKFGNITSL